MHFWRVDRLKARLNTGPLTDRELLPYVAANGAAFGLALAFPPAYPNGWDTAIGLLTIPLSMIGLWWVYRQNGGEAGRDFLPRCTVVGWVVGVRVVSVALVLRLALYSIEAGPPDEPIRATWVDMCFTTLVGAVYYQRLGSHVRQLAHPRDTVLQRASDWQDGAAQGAAHTRNTR